MEENTNNKFEMNKEIEEIDKKVTKNRKNSKLIIALVVMLIILVLLIIFCVSNTYALKKDYKNIFDMMANMDKEQEKDHVMKDENDFKGDEEKEVYTQETIKEDKNKAYIYEWKSHEDKIKIPYININSEDAKKINQEIDKMYEEAVKTVVDEEDHEYEGERYTEITYKYSIFKNLICLCIDKTDIIVPSGGFIPDRKIYNINLEDGKTLSTQEVLTKLNFTEEQLIEKIKLDLRQNYNDSYYGITIDKYVEGFDYDINTVYFKSLNVAVIMATGNSVPYGYYESEVNLLRDQLQENATVQIPGKYSFETEHTELSNSVILNEDNTCLIYFGVTGDSFEGNYEILGNTLICKLNKLKGEYISDTEINVEYHFIVKDEKTLQFKDGTGEIKNVYSTLDKKEYNWEDVNVFEKDAIFTEKEGINESVPDVSTIRNKLTTYLTNINNDVASNNISDFEIQFSKREDYKDEYRNMKMAMLSSVCAIIVKAQEYESLSYEELCNYNGEHFNNAEDRYLISFTYNEHTTTISASSYEPNYLLFHGYDEDKKEKIIYKLDLKQSALDLLRRLY